MRITWDQVREHTVPVEFYETLNERALAQRELGAIGVPAVPFAVRMLKSRDRQTREDGAGILTALKERGALRDILEAFRNEEDQTVREALIVAMGAIRDSLALPVLQAILDDPEGNPETASLALSSVEAISGVQFKKGLDGLAQARQWFEER